MATPARAEEQTAPQADTQEKDSPLLDLSDAAVKRLIKTAKARGFVTLDQLNAVLPSQEVSPDQIEDTMSMLSDMGITVVESEEAEEGATDKDDSADESAEDAEEGSRAIVAPSLPTTTSARSEPTDRTDDPVRMYLRDMGSVELLSREGEIAIAKRIEAGREAMIAGLCESPLTFQAIIIWRDELNNAKILLRDIIDLEATYEGPEAKNAPPPMPVPHEAPAPAAAPAARRRRWRRRAAPRRRDGRRGRFRERHVARGHGGRAQAQGARDLRQHRRRLQEAAQAAGQARRDARGQRADQSLSSRRPTTRRATRSSRTSRASRSTTPASRCWWSSSTRSTATWCSWKAA